LKVLATKMCQLKSLELESEADNDVSLYQAILTGHVQVIRRLLARRTLLTAIDRHGRTALHLAAGYSGNHQALAVLLEHGASVS
jgi:ankyrin repeat protein